MATYAHTFTSGETVTPTKLNDARTVSNIVNADISSAANIAHSKLATIAAGQVLLGNASNVPAATAISGDATISNTGVVSIANNAVTSAKLDDGSVTTIKLATNAVDASKIQDLTITTNKIDDNQITNAKLDSTTRLRIAKAWVNFNGTTSPGTIRSSYNVSSVTKNGTGDYTINFTTALADANYSVSFGNVGASLTNTTYNTVIAGTAAGGANLKTTSAIRILSGATNAAVMTDLSEISVQIFGN